MRDKILNWLASGKVGISSKVMACVAAGIPCDRGFPPYTPSDPDDLNRCLLLLDKVPEIRKHFDEIAKVSDEWEALIKRWGEVEKCFIDEVGFDWCNGSRASKTYELMKSIGC